MSRRYFEFLYAETCVSVGRRLPRYRFWQRVAETVGDPDDLTRDQIARFLEIALDDYLASERSQLVQRDRERLVGRLLRFDPRYPTPEEWLLSLDRSAA